MWFSKSRGKISGTKEELRRLANCTENEFANFLHEIARKRFGNKVQRGDIITLKSRRMIKEEKARQATRERVRKHRSNADVTEMQHQCNNASPSPTPSSLLYIYNTATNGEVKLIKSIYRIPKFPKPPKETLAYLQEKIEKYGFDVVSGAVESYVDKKTGGEKLTASPLGQLTTYIKNEKKWRENGLTRKGKRSGGIKPEPGKYDKYS